MRFQVARSTILTIDLLKTENNWTHSSGQAFHEGWGLLISPCPQLYWHCLFRWLMFRFEGHWPLQKWRLGRCASRKQQKHSSSLMCSVFLSHERPSWNLEVYKYKPKTHLQKKQLVRPYTQEKTWMLDLLNESTIKMIFLEDRKRGNWLSRCHKSGDAKPYLSGHRHDWHLLILAASKNLRLEFLREVPIIALVFGVSAWPSRSRCIDCLQR